MKNIEATVEPTLETIEDYNGMESKEKKMTVWIVILAGLLIGAIYGIVRSNSSVSDALSVDSGIIKY